MSIAWSDIFCGISVALNVSTILIVRKTKKMLTKDGVPIGKLTIYGSGGPIRFDDTPESVATVADGDGGGGGNGDG